MSTSQVYRKSGERHKQRIREKGGPLVFVEYEMRHREIEYGCICERCGSHNSRSSKQCCICGYILPPSE